MAEAFGLNDELLDGFGLDDAEVGQSSVTKPPVQPGVGQVANAAKYIPKQPQYSDAYVPSEDVPGAMTGMGPTRPVQNYTPQQLAGAEQGVNIDAPPIVDTGYANFARTKQTRDNYISDLVKQKLGPNTQVRIGTQSKTGEPEYFDPDAKQWMMVPDSIKGKLTNAIPATGEAIGAIGGSYLPLPGVSSSVLGGVGRGAGQWLKNKIGEGVPGAGAEDARDAVNPYNEGLEATAIGGAANLVTNGIPLAYRLAVKGKDVVPTSEAAQSIMRSFDENSDFVKQINGTMEGMGRSERYQPNIAKVAALPDKNGVSNVDAHGLLANEPLILNTNKELADREMKRRANNENVIELYWRSISKNPKDVANVSQDNWQAQMKNYYDAFKDGRLGPYQKSVEDALDQASAAAGQQGRGAMDETTMGQMIRDVIGKASEESEGRVTAAWAKYEDAAGYKPDTIASDNQVPVTKQLASTMNILNSLKRDNLLKSQATQAERYTPQIGEATNADDLALAESLGVKLEEGGTVDLAMLDRTIKDLNAEANQASKGTVSDGMSSANRNLLLRNLKKSREEFLADKPELSTALAEANAQTARHGQEFKDSFLGTFLVRDNAYGGMRVANPTVLDHIMRNSDPAASRQLADLIKGEPGSKQAVVDYIDAFYNDKFTKKLADGTLQLDARKHASFVRDVLPRLRPFLTDAEYAQYGRLGGIAQNVVAQKEQWRLAQKAWSQTDDGRLGSKLSSETLVSSFFDPNKSDKNFKFISRYLGDDAVDLTRQGIMSAIVQKATNPKTGLVDVDKLAGIVNPIQDRMTQYFGKDTVNNINSVLRAGQAEKVVAGGRPLGGDTALSTASKVILGPLSAENRKITFLKNLRTKNTAYRVEEAMYNPKELPRLAQELSNRQTKAGERSRAGYLILKGGEQMYDND